MQSEIETVLENPGDPNCTWVTNIKRDDFERLMILAEALQRPMDFKRKFRVVLEHDPEKSAMEIRYIMG